MRIKVTQYYQGRASGERVIAAGIYEVGDERLCGLEDYLVNVQQKAVYLEDDVLAPALVANNPPPPEEEIDFKGRKLKVKKAE